LPRRADALDCFTKLSRHDVEVWNDHVHDVDAPAERIAGTEAVVLFASASRSARQRSRSSLGCKPESGVAQPRREASVPGRGGGLLRNKAVAVMRRLTVVS